MEVDEVQTVGDGTEAKEEKELETSDPDTYTFYFVIDRIADLLQTKIRSETHEFIGFKWRLLVFPRGDTQQHALSVYLECEGPVDDENGPPDPNWSKKISFKLFVCSQGPESSDVSNDTSHRFHKEVHDWGFKELISFETLFSLCESYLLKGSLKLGATLSAKVVEEYDSKKETGFNGFKNQGATCYMNSLLQILFTLGEFRHSVFLMDIPDDIEEDKISFALQKVFYELQNGSTVVKTKKLTKSFGWDSADAFTQHDVQELNRILCSHLEESMRKRNGKNKISELFEGKLLNYIECVNVPYKSTREEPFFDLSLTVKGNETIYESFDKYTEVELLNGDNKYRADGYDELQEARKGVKFLSLPPVLQLHLKRFEYDYMRDVNVKINDRFEFPEELDLRKYVSKSDGTEIYVLHSVLVHVGDVHAGHYFVFIQPDADTRQWYKFDDETVTRVDEKEAIEDNFGSPASRKFSNAYMLQYIRKSQVHDILKKLSAEDIPKALEDRIRCEAEEEENRKKEQAEQFLLMDVTLVTEEAMAMHNGVDLISWDKTEKKRLKKEMLLRDLRASLQTSHCNKMDGKIRLWRMSQRPNHTIRTDRLLDHSMDDMTLIRLAEAASELKLFVEQVDLSEEDDLCDGEIIQFFKIYSSKPVPLLLYVGHLLVHRDWCFANVLPKLCKWEALPQEVIDVIKREEVTFIEEVTPGALKAFDIHCPFAQSEMADGGDIIVIQLPPQINLALTSIANKVEIPMTPLQGHRELTTVAQYYDYLLNRIQVEFRDITKPTEPGILLEMMKTDSYWETRRRLAETLRSDLNPDRIRLYPYDGATHGPRMESLSLAQLNSRGDSLNRMLEMGSCPGLYPPEVKMFWYELTDYDVQEFEEKEEVRVTWRYDRGTSIPGTSSTIEKPENCPAWMATKRVSVLVPFDTSTYSDVIHEMRIKLGMPPELPVRLLEIKDSYIRRVISPTEIVPRGFHRRMNSTQSDHELRAEPEGLEKEEGLEDGAYKLVQVLQIPKNSTNSRRAYFGTPFLLGVRSEGETVRVLRDRIRRKIRVHEEEFQSWRLAEVTATNIEFLEDEDAVWNTQAMPNEEVYLAIEHIRRIPPKRTHGVGKHDKPLIIKIKG